LSYQEPVPLAQRHDLSRFTCRSNEQTDWLRDHARQSTASGSTKVFVVTHDHGDRVVAYYGWTMASLDHQDAPDRLVKGQGRYPQPVALLARLGVDRDHEGKGLAAGLLRDVLQRLFAMSDEIGCRGLLVHAESAEARDFYLHVLPDFAASPTDALHLVLLTKDIRKTLSSAMRDR